MDLNTENQKLSMNDIEAMRTAGKVGEGGGYGRDSVWKRGWQGKCVREGWQG